LLGLDPDPRTIRWWRRAARLVELGVSVNGFRFPFTVAGNLVVRVA
jgi:hypothetical protein